MAKKTVLKMLINRWGILASSDMAIALQADQAVVSKNYLNYVDNDGRTVPRDDYSQLDEPLEVETIDPETEEILEGESNVG